MGVYKKILKLFIVITALTTGFVINGAFSKVALAAEKPVELYRAEYEFAGYYGGTANGYICVKNIAYDKKITVHYLSGNEWKDAPATYYKSNSDGTEMWRFRIGFKELSTKFAIKYEVNGETYWDNNDGKDYYLSYIIANKFAFGKGKVCLRDSHGEIISETDEKLARIQVCAKNIEGATKIKVRYTEDNGVTFKEVVTSKYEWGMESSTNMGIKYEYTDIPVAKDTKQVKFEICYEVNGIEYWDNNFGESYTIDFK